MAAQSAGMSRVASGLLIPSHRTASRAWVWVIKIEFALGSFVVYRNACPVNSSPSVNREVGPVRRLVLPFGLVVRPTEMECEGSSSDGPRFSVFMRRINCRISTLIVGRPRRRSREHHRQKSGKPGSPSAP